MKYEEKYGSLSTHKIPRWYDDAKLGIFIHWGLYSVPAFAEPGDINDKIKKFGHGPHFYFNPYAEWYHNTYQLKGSQAQEYHNKTYGDDFDYKDFQPLFEEKANTLDARAWAKDFKDFGAQYVVMVTKHHDGYCLWPSEVENPETKNYYSKRDLVGDVFQAVRDEGLRMGVYYSGVIDWSVRNYPASNTYTLAKNYQHDKDYIEYADAQYKELIHKYKPDVLWNDIGFPRPYDLNTLFAHYYNNVPEGVINDRWEQDFIPKAKVLQPIVKLVCNRIDKKTKQIEFNVGEHTKYWYDYKTPEYSSYEDRTAFKWEMIRGVGDSFGYNRMEKNEDMLTGSDMIKLLIDVVSKNGNLLINIGPKPDGTIPELQRQALKELGYWLSKSGEAIYGTRPHTTCMSHTAQGTEVYFTRKDNKLYIILMGELKERLTIKNMDCLIKNIRGLSDVLVENHTSNNGDLHISLQAKSASPVANVLVAELN